MRLLDSSGSPVSINRLRQYRNLAVYPGSFNPLHHGHKGIYDLLTARGYHVIFEISKTRYQKAPYPEKKFQALTKQFAGFSELLISDAPLFSDKRDQLAHFNPCWVMGYDTAKRWINENKRVDDTERKKIATMNVIFIGRLIDGIYHDPSSLLDGSERYRYQIVDYRCDISSTQIRMKNQPPL